MSTVVAPKKSEYLHPGHADIAQRRRKPVAGRRNRAQSSLRALFLAACLSCAFLVGVGAGLVGVYASITSLEMQRALLMKKIEKENQLLQERKAQFASLSQPERIRKIAEEKLGMVEATQIVFLHVQLDKDSDKKSLMLSKATPPSQPRNLKSGMR